MNAPIRRLSVLVTLMFALLLVFGSWVQFATAKDLRDKPDNSRTRLASYGQERGAILVDQAQVARSEKNDGVIKFKRVYPQGPLYSHLTGYFSMLYGSNGLEAAQDDLLSGTSDSLFYRRLGDLLTGQRSTGVSLELTVDARVQQAADKALGNRKGAVVALDPKTGAILGMVSHPQYDPNSISTLDNPAAQKAWTALEGDKSKPMFNRAAMETYAPGSTFKVIVSAAALAAGKDDNTQLDGTARLDLPNSGTPLTNEWGGPCGGGSPTITEALARSCNTSFGALGMELGADRIKDMAKKFGFETRHEYPMANAISTVGDVSAQSYLAVASIGQQGVTATPLQMAMVAAGVANGGSVMKPHLIKQTRGASLEIIDTTKPEEFSRALSKDQAATLTRMMTQVTEAPYGTAAAARIPGMSVAGKTGTAETGVNNQGQDHSWFIGFAPANDPKIAVAIVFEHGGGSIDSGQAAVLATDVMKAGINR